MAIGSAHSPSSTQSAALLLIKVRGSGRHRSSKTANSAGAVCRKSFPPNALATRFKGGPNESTTLVIVATDAILTKAQAKRLAVMAQSGLSRAIYPIHTPLDGDVLFAASTGQRPLADPQFGLTGLGSLAAHVVARAIARGVYEATALPFSGAVPSWREQFSREHN